MDEPVDVTTRPDIAGLPNFVRGNLDSLPDPQAARVVVTAHEDALAEFKAHPYYDGPTRQDEAPSLAGPPTFQRLGGRLDGLFLALKWLALPLADEPGYNEEWRPYGT
jgi:hypothetical protein